MLEKPIAICFKDVQRGDVVCEKEGGTLLRVGKAGQAPGDHTGKLYLVGKVFGTEDFYMFYGRPDQFIGLVHRPWPEGVSDGSYLRIIADLMDQFKALGPGSEREKVLTDLCHEIETHKLGKSPEEGEQLEFAPEQVKQAKFVAQEDPAGGC